MEFVARASMPALHGTGAFVGWAYLPTATLNGIRCAGKYARPTRYRDACRVGILAKSSLSLAHQEANHVTHFANKQRRVFFRPFGALAHWSRRCETGPDSPRSPRRTSRNAACGSTAAGGKRCRGIRAGCYGTSGPAATHSTCGGEISTGRS